MNFKRTYSDKTAISLKEPLLGLHLLLLLSLVSFVPRIVSANDIQETSYKKEMSKFRMLQPYPSVADPICLPYWFCFRKDQMDYRFTDVFGTKAEFSAETTLTQPERLPLMRYDGSIVNDPQRLAHDMSAIAITPEGKISVAELLPDDIAMFAQESSPLESQGDNAGKSWVSDSFRGFISLKDTKKTLLTGTGGRQAPGNTDIILERGRPNDSALESVIGADERIKIQTTASYPFRSIGMLVNQNNTSNSTTICTGTLIGPRHVLTAAHCVYDIENDLWYKEISFNPGKNGRVSPFGSYKWRKIIAPRGWVRSNDSNYDYAMIVLDKPIGLRLGWLGTGYKKGPWTVKVNIAGYPGDKSIGTMWKEDCAMANVPSNQQRVLHLCDTAGGMSGAGLFEFTPLTRSYIIRAIHTMGLNGTTNANQGVNITNRVFSVIRGWMKQYP